MIEIDIAAGGALRARGPAAGGIATGGGTVAVADRNSCLANGGASGVDGGLAVG